MKDAEQGCIADTLTGCTRYEYINLTDEDEESAPIDTTTRGNQGSSFDFDTCDSEPIDVDLNPQK